MRETFGARNPRSWQMRFHSQTAGVVLDFIGQTMVIVAVTVEHVGRHDEDDGRCTKAVETWNSAGRASRRRLVA